ncbi:TRAP transporter permease [Anaplasmataceae bacterium AB001_6]|nr:TRAP transporter permease [Anaplasmataceae bacterium AB001_6]
MVRKDLKKILEKEYGSRPDGKSRSFKFLFFIALLWSLMQVYVASPAALYLTSIFHIQAFVLNDQKVRILHLLFGVIMVLMSFAGSKGSSTSSRIPWFDWLLISFIALSLSYLFIFYNSINQNIGLTTFLQVCIAYIGLAILLESARRAVGLAIVILALLCLSYALLAPFFPDFLASGSISLKSIITHQWFTAEGVFGTALGVSADFIFLYVLFGNLLEKTGAGDFFIKLSFSLLGSFRGGPAQASVVASGLMGMISGSSIANTITVGSLTIPIMKKLGFQPEKAAAIEVSAGVNGQVMPPVMGAAAFLMAEYLSMPYDQIIKYAFLPAVLIYIALLYMVRIEAIKLNLRYNDTVSLNPLRMIFRFFICFITIFIVVGTIYFLIEGFNNFLGIKKFFGHDSIYVVTFLFVAAYLTIVFFNRSMYDLDETIEQEENDILSNKDTWYRILRRGLHFLLPIFLLVWLLIVERLSPASSAYWTVLSLFFILFFHDGIVCFMRRDFSSIKRYLRLSFGDTIDSLVSTARNMSVVAVATATAGIIVGSVSLTGIGLKFGTLIDIFSFGNVIFALLITGFVCIILGMGMPTTACYIIVATIMVPVLKQLTYMNGMFVIPVSLHLFVFYFGILADVTPPVGLASYTSAAIARANPLKTGIQAFYYNIRTIVIPFLFIFNHKLVYYGLSSLIDGLFVTIFAVVGILAISIAMQSYLITKNSVVDNILFAAVGLLMMCPNIVTHSNYILDYRNVEIENHIIDQHVDQNFDLLKLDIKGKFHSSDRVVKIYDYAGEKFYSVKHALVSLGVKQYHLTDDNSMIIVDSVSKGTPAYFVGIKRGDMIKNLSTACYRFTYYQICSAAAFVFILLFLKKKYLFR